jgi:hypothetical protein
MSVDSVICYRAVPKSPSIPVKDYEIDPALRLIVDEGDFFAWTLTDALEEDIAFLKKLSFIPKHLRMTGEAFEAIGEIAKNVLNIRSISTSAIRAEAFEGALCAMKDLTDVDLTASGWDLERFDDFSEFEGPTNRCPVLGERYTNFHSWFSTHFFNSVPHLQVLKLLCLLRIGLGERPLRGLSLAQCKQIDDFAIGRLSLLPDLEELDLSGTGITEAAIPVLEKFPKLKKLNLKDTKALKALPAESPLQKMIV